MSTETRPSADSEKAIGLGFGRNVWALSIASFLRDVASEMLTHTVPLFLANVLGVRLNVVGLIEGLAETVASLAKIGSGRFSDRIGRRKGLTATGYGVAAVALLILRSAVAWPTVLGARLLDRLGKGIRTAPRDALLAESVAPERRGAAFGIHRAADSAGALVGLLLAMALVWHSQRGRLSLDPATFRTLVTWSLVPAILAALVVALGVREVVRPRAAPGDAPVQSAALDGRFWRFLAVMVLFTLGNSSDAFLVLRAQDAGASVVTVLGMLAAFNLTYATLSGPAGALSDRIPRRRLMIGGWLLYAVVYVGFAVVGSGAWLWVLFPLYGVYYAMTEGVAKAVVADLVPDDRRGTAFGYYHAAIGLTALPASVLAGVLWQGIGSWAGFGPAAPFGFGALLALVAGLLFFRWV